MKIGQLVDFILFQARVQTAVLFCRRTLHLFRSHESYIVIRQAIFQKKLTMWATENKGILIWVLLGTVFQLSNAKISNLESPGPPSVNSLGQSSLIGNGREAGTSDDGIFYPSLALNPNIPMEERFSLNMPFRLLLDEDGVEYPPEIGNVTVGEVLISLEHDAMEAAR